MLRKFKKLINTIEQKNEQKKYCQKTRKKITPIPYKQLPTFKYEHFGTISDERNNFYLLQIDSLYLFFSLMVGYNKVIPSMTEEAYALSILE